MDNSVLNTVKGGKSADAAKVDPYFTYNIETNHSKCNLCLRSLSGYKIGNLIRHLNRLHSQILLELDLDAVRRNNKRKTENETSEASMVKKTKKLKVF